MKKQNISVKKLITYFGNQEKTAERMKVAQPTVSGWLTGKHGIDEFNALKAEKLTQGEIKAVDLCPKLAELDSQNINQ